MTHEKNHIMKESRKNQNEMLDNTNHGEITILHRECIFIEVVINHTMKVAGQKMECMMRTQAFFHVTPEDTDQEKMKLLRMANKLQDRHKKTPI
jgi:hypothetical protein